MPTVVAPVERDSALTSEGVNLVRLKSAFEQRLRKVGVSCVPDFLNETDVNATEEEALLAVEELVAENVIQRVPDARAKYPSQIRYELLR